MDRMRTGKKFWMGAIGMLFIFPLSALAFFGPYGKLWVQPGGQERVTIEMLEQKWQDYDVYYAGPWIGRPSAVMFDPKGDDNKLVPHKWWVQVKTREELAEAVWGIRVQQISFFPLVRMILGPDKQLYGYMYTAWNHVLIKQIDEKTLWVDDIPLPRLDPASTENVIMGD